MKRVKCLAILYSLPKQLNLVLSCSWLTVQFSVNYAVELTSFFTYIVSRIYSKFGRSVAGYDKLYVGFQPMGNGEIC